MKSINKIEICYDVVVDFIFRYQMSEEMNMFKVHGIKRDHEEGICPMSGKEFQYPDSEDYLCWTCLSCSECGEVIGSRACELRNYFTSNCDPKHRMGLCPKTNKQFTLPTATITDEFTCSECGEVIDWM